MLELFVEIYGRKLWLKSIGKWWKALGSLKTCLYDSICLGLICLRVCFEFMCVVKEQDLLGWEFKVKPSSSFFADAYVFNIPIVIMISVELSLVKAFCGLWEWEKNGAQMEGWYVYFVWDWCCNNWLFYVTSIIDGLWSKMIMRVWAWSLVW